MFDFKNYGEMTNHLRDRYYRITKLSKLCFVGICAIIGLASLVYFLAPIGLIVFFDKYNILKGIVIVYSVVFAILIARDLNKLAKILSHNEEIKYDFLVKKP